MTLSTDSAQALDATYRGRRVLITGGLGFIGSNLAHRLVDLGADVLLVDSLIPEYGGNLFNIAGIRDRVRVNVADVRDEHSMRYLVQGQDYIFALAGQVSHTDSMTDPYTDLEINCRAQLTLRIPVGKLDDAVFRLTQLGTVTAQRTNSQDLQGPLDRTTDRIAHLRSQIRIELARLASGELDAAEELQARIHLENLRRNLREAKADRRALVSRTSMADLTLRLATPVPGAADKSESGIAGAVDKAGDFLRGAGAVAVFLALVLSPLIVLGILAWLALRARSRRIEARLLEDPQPGSTRSS